MSMHSMVEAASNETKAFKPVCDLQETTQSYVITVAIGANALADVELECVDGKLTVTGKLILQSGEPGIPLQEEFQLPGPVEARALDAHYHAGVLTIVTPKAVDAASWAPRTSPSVYFRPALSV